MTNLAIDPHDGAGTRQDHLERIVDAYGLAETVSALSIICGEKASHIEENWQDFNLAAHWQDASNQLDDLANRFFQVTGLYRAGDNRRLTAEIAKAAAALNAEQAKK